MSNFLIISALLSNEPIYLKTQAKDMQCIGNTLITIDTCTQNIKSIDEKPTLKKDEAGNFEIKNKKHIFIQQSSIQNPKNKLICRTWDIETGKMIDEYVTKNMLGKVCISKEGLVANLNLQGPNPILSIYDVKTKQLIKTIYPNFEVSSDDVIYFNRFFGDTLYLHGQTWYSRSLEDYTRKYDIKTGQEVYKYETWLDTINETEEYGCFYERHPVIPFHVYNLTDKEVTWRKDTAGSSAECWLNDSTLINAPYTYDNQGNYSSLQLVAHNVIEKDDEITCVRNIEPTKDNFIKALCNQNGEYILSSNKKGVIQSWNMQHGQEKPKYILKLDEPAKKLESIKNGLIAAGLLQEKIAIFPIKINTTQSYCTLS